MFDRVPTAFTRLCFALRQKRFDVCVDIIFNVFCKRRLGLSYIRLFHSSGSCEFYNLTWCYANVSADTRMS